MEEIKVGEYFRNDNIGIMKFIYGTTYITKDDKEDYIYYLEYENGKTMPLNKKGLKNMKHNPEIIGLIEERRLCKWRKSRANIFRRNMSIY